jgi:cell division protein FtsB
MNKKLVGHTLFYLILALFGLLSIFGHSGLLKLFALSRANNKLRTHICEAQQKNKELEQEIQRWQRYPFYKEQMAREQLQLAYPDDIIFYF